MSKRQNLPYFPQTFRQIPETSPGMLMVLQGASCEAFSSITIIDTTKTPVVSHSYKHDEMVEILLYGTVRKVSVPWLVFFTFSPLYKAQSFAHLFEVHRDKPNSPTMALSEMSWVIPEGGVEDPEVPGFKILPFYTGASVSKNGEIWSRYLNRLLAVRLASNGKGNTYLNASITNNAGHHDTVGMHRVLAMGFKRLEGNPFKFTVNHPDGVKANNALDNLEWASYTVNNLHAKEAGLNKARTAVLLRDYKENYIKRFKSLSDVGLYLGANTGGLVAFANKGGVYKGRYEIIKVDDLANNMRAWEEKYFEDLGMVVTNPRIDDSLEVGRRVVVYDVAADKATILADQYQTAIHLKEEPRDILRRLLRRSRYICKGVVVCYIEEVKEVVARVKAGSMPTVEDGKPFFGKVGVVFTQIARDGARKEMRLVVEDIDKFLVLYVTKSMLRHAKAALINDGKWSNGTIEIAINNGPSVSDGR